MTTKKYKNTKGPVQIFAFDAFFVTANQAESVSLLPKIPIWTKNFETKTAPGICEKQLFHPPQKEPGHEGVEQQKAKVLAGGDCY